MSTNTSAENKTYVSAVVQGMDNSFELLPPATTLDTDAGAVDKYPDWLHLPTKQEYLSLVNGNYLCFSPTDIECASQFTIEAIQSQQARVSKNKRVKSNLIDLDSVEEYKIWCQENLELVPWSYTFPSEQYDAQSPRTQEEIIRNIITDCEKKTYEINHPQMWRDLSEKLSEDGWLNLWKTADYHLIFQTNWFLYLLKIKTDNEAKLQKEKQQKAYEAASYLSRAIGWY
jgi:hypothetical protein